MRELFFLFAAITMSFGYSQSVTPITPKHSIYQPIEVHKDPAFQPEQYYERLKQAFEQQDYRKVIELNNFISEHFEEEAFFAELPYYTGRAYVFLDDYDLANKQFTVYLRTPGVLHFDEVVQLKFEIGKMYAGKIKTPFHSIRQLVRLPFHKQKAIQIFDEVISLVAFSDLAAYSLYYKGEILNQMGEYKEAIECFDSVIKGFGLHELLPESYVGIAEAYFLQYKYSNSKNPDLLDLAKLNLQRFIAQFPQSDATQRIQKRLTAMKEEYVADLYETARFYERTKKWHAARMYYQNIMENFSDTSLAGKCKKRFHRLANK